jgi:glycolate oxidase iron-sulfur subunit
VLSQRNRAAFAALDVAAVLTLASGCHEQIAMALSDSPPVQDLCDFLALDPHFADLSLRAARPGTRVALHLPCTQRNVSRTASQVAPVLARIPGLDVVALPANGCCGAAGSHMIEHPARAADLRAPLLDAVEASGADRLCSANVGCRMHLDAGAGSRELSLLVQHPVQLIDEHLA